MTTPPASAPLLEVEIRSGPGDLHTVELTGELGFGTEPALWRPVEQLMADGDDSDEQFRASHFARTIFC